MHILESKTTNECFNIGVKNYIKNIDVVRTVLDWFGKTEDYVQYVDNRWGQDVRYSIDNQKLINLGWKPDHPKGIYNWHEEL
jgi:dTDP-D-glucose 4,6-dehydratase